MDTATYIKRMEEAVKKASSTMSTLIAENRKLKSRVEELESIIESKNYVESKQQSSSIQLRNPMPNREDILGIKKVSSIDSSNVSNVVVPLTNLSQDKVSVQDSTNAVVVIEDDHLEDISNLIDDELDDDSDIDIDIDIDNSIPITTEDINVNSNNSSGVTGNNTAVDPIISPNNATYRGGDKPIIDISTIKSTITQDNSLKRKRGESSPIADNQLGTTNKKILNEVSNTNSIPSKGRLGSNALDNTLERPLNRIHNNITTPLSHHSTDSIFTSTTSQKETIHNTPTPSNILPQITQNNNTNNVNHANKGSRKVGWDDISPLMHSFSGNTINNNLNSKKKKIRWRKSISNEINDTTILKPELQVRALLDILKDSNIHSIAHALQSYKSNIIISEIILSLKSIAKLSYNEWNEITQLNVNIYHITSESSPTSPVILKKISLFVQLCSSCLIGDKDATHVKIDSKVSKRRKFLSLLKSKIVEWIRTQRLHDEDGECFPLHIAFFSGSLSSSVQYLEHSIKMQSNSSSSSSSNNKVDNHATSRPTQSGNTNTETDAEAGITVTLHSSDDIERHRNSLLERDDDPRQENCQVDIDFGYSDSDKVSDSDSDSNESKDIAIFRKETKGNGCEVSSHKMKKSESNNYNDNMDTVATSSGGDIIQDRDLGSNTTTVTPESEGNLSDGLLLGLDDISDLDSSDEEGDDGGGREGNNQTQSRLRAEGGGAASSTANTVNNSNVVGINNSNGSNGRNCVVEGKGVASESFTEYEELGLETETETVTRVNCIESYVLPSIANKGTPASAANATATATATATAIEATQISAGNQKYQIQRMYSFLTATLYTSLGLHLDMLDEVLSFINDAILCCYSPCPGLVAGMLLSLHCSDISMISVQQDIEALLEFLKHIYLSFQNHLVKLQPLPSILLPTSDTFSYAINMIERVHLKICSSKGSSSLWSISPPVNQRALAGSVETSFTTDSMSVLFKSLKEDQKKKIIDFINSTGSNSNPTNSNGYLQHQIANSSIKINPKIVTSIKCLLMSKSNHTANKAVNGFSGSSQPTPGSIANCNMRITLMARSLGFWKSVSLACSGSSRPDTSPSTDTAARSVGYATAASTTATATNSTSVFASLGLGGAESVAAKLLCLTTSLQSKQYFTESDFISDLCLLDINFFTRTQAAGTVSDSSEGQRPTVTFHSQEARLLARFRHYWNEVIHSNNHNNNNSHSNSLLVDLMSALQLLKCLVSSVSEYCNEDGSSGGRQWHIEGVSGSSSLDDELMKAHVSLKAALLRRSVTVSTSTAATEVLVAQSLSSASPSPLTLFALTSVTLPTMIRCTSLFDFTLSLWNKFLCIPKTETVSCSLDEGQIDNPLKESSDVLSAMRRLLGLLSAALFEQLVALSCVSVRALLQALSSRSRSRSRDREEVQQEVARSSSSSATTRTGRSSKNKVVDKDIEKEKEKEKEALNRTEEWNVIIPEAISFISSMSSLSGGSQHAEMLLELSVSLQCLHSRHQLSSQSLSRSRCSPPWTPRHLSRLFHRMSSKLPAIIINLDRRADRWSRCLDACDRHGILPVRYSAIDGTAAAAGDMTHLVPESAVTQTWDSSLNHCFDASCVANKHSTLTNSERACAASHLRCWMALHKLFQKDQRGYSLKKSYEETDNYFKNFEVNEKKFQQLLEHTTTLTSEGGMGWTVKAARVGQEGGGGSLGKCTRYSVILEDDMHIVDSSGTLGSPNTPLSCLISDCVYRLPMDFDICYLGYALPKQEKVFEMGFLKPKYLWQLHAYILSEFGVAKLLQHLPINGPVDNFIAALIYDDKLKAYAVKEQLVRQVGDKLKGRQKDSDIIHSGRF